MSVLVQNSIVTNLSNFVVANALQKLSTLSKMLDYNVDNTLNTIKAKPTNEVDQMTRSFYQSTQPTQNLVLTPSPSPPSSLVDSTDHDMQVTLPPSPPTTPQLQNVARKRWKILAKVLRKDSEETVSSSSGSEDVSEEQTASVRRFKSFDLLRQDSFEDHMTLDCLGKPENWYKYRIVLDYKDQIEYNVNIHHMERQLTATDLMGFNNTGNICVWPSEEALTAYVLSDLAAYRGKWILELGGGFTCLTGLMLSKYAKPYAVHLTDGNEVSVENVRKTICLNELSCYTKCSVLKWEDFANRLPAEANKFDTILSADCLFFDEARNALVDTIWFYLADDGVALIMAPKRGKTMNLFINACLMKGFCVQIVERYNETIWQRHLELKNSNLYEEDLHYPMLLRLQKPTAITVKAEAKADADTVPKERIN